VQVYAFGIVFLMGLFLMEKSDRCGIGGCQNANKACCGISMPPTVPKKVARKSLHCWAATLTTVPEIRLAVKPCAAQVCHIAARLTHHQLCASMAAVAPIAAVHARIMPADLGVPARLVLVDLCLPVDAPIVVVLRCLALDGRPKVPA
jgi:hypothetical protein